MNTATKEFYDLLTDDNARGLADLVVRALNKNEVENGFIKSLDYDFSVKGGKMSYDLKHLGNTKFSFDFLEGSVYRDLAKYLSNPDVDEVLTRERFMEFLEKVKVYLKSDDRFGEKLGNLVLGNGAKVKDVEIVDLFIYNLPEIDWSLTVNKKTVLGSPSNPVAPELLDIHISTGEDFNDIIDRKKLEGDPKYKYVESATKNKNFYECELSIWADYSFVD